MFLHYTINNRFVVLLGINYPCIISTINNRFVVLLGMNHIYFINIKRIKKCSLTHPITYQFTLTHTIYTLNYIFSSVNLHSCLTTFYIFCQFTLSLIYIFLSNSSIYTFSTFSLFIFINHEYQKDFWSHCIEMSGN